MAAPSASGPPSFYTSPLTHHSTTAADFNTSLPPPSPPTPPPSTPPPSPPTMHHSSTPPPLHFLPSPHSPTEGGEEATPTSYTEEPDHPSLPEVVDDPQQSPQSTPPPSPKGTPPPSPSHITDPGETFQSDLDLSRRSSGSPPPSIPSSPIPTLLNENDLYPTKSEEHLEAVPV